jgi:hypothetical protein
MSSVKRTFAQRNNNVQTLVPTGTNANINDFININVDPLYTSVINVDVRNVTPYNRGAGDNIQLFNIVYDRTLAARYPGMEFTVFFDSYNSSSIPVSTRVVIKTVDRQDPTESYYPFSAVPGATLPVMSVTLKSNGRVFSVISGGPSYWS